MAVRCAVTVTEFPSPEAERALLETATGDPDRDVRTVAATSLLLLRGVLSSLLDLSRRDLMIRLDSDDPAVLAAAADELRALVGAKIGGITETG